MYYFAYGSNMCTARLGRRVPGVRPVGPAWLEGHRLYWHLRGHDGSGKCNIVATGNTADHVYGVLFEFDVKYLDSLHAAEGPAYHFLELEIGYGDRRVSAATYRGRAEWLDDSLIPYRWYHDFVLAGAREHGLPGFWIKQLASVAAVDDPDATRMAENRAILG